MRSRVRVDDNVVEEQVIGLLKNVVDDHQHREQERTTERETLRATGPLYDYAYCRLHEMKCKKERKRVREREWSKTGKRASSSMIVDRLTYCTTHTHTHTYKY